MGEFYVASAGAAAALAGLVIVALSVNVDKVINMHGQVTRAGAAIAILIAATVISLAALVEQDPIWTAIEIGVAAIAALLIAFRSIAVMVSGRGDESWSSAFFRTAIPVVPALTFIAAAVLIAFGIEAGPLLAIGTILSIVIGVVTTWVLLVEIRR